MARGAVVVSSTADILMGPGPATSLDLTAAANEGGGTGEKASACQTKRVANGIEIFMVYDNCDDGRWPMDDERWIENVISRPQSADTRRLGITYFNL